MGKGKVAGFAKEMERLIELSGQVNLTIAAANASEDVRRMNNLSLWLTLVFAFEGFVQHVYKELGYTKHDFDGKKAGAKDEPDVVIRLRVLSEKKGLDLRLPEESGDKVIRRHFLLRNKWAHNLGVVEQFDKDLAKISCLAGPGRQAWPTDAGWSELRCAVGNLTTRMLSI